MFSGVRNNLVESSHKFSVGLYCLVELPSNEADYSDEGAEANRVYGVVVSDVGQVVGLGLGSGQLTVLECQGDELF